MYRKFKLLMYSIIFMVFMCYYLGWIRETFPNPMTGFLIRTISGMIIGAVLSIYYFRKFRQEVAFDKSLPPDVALVRIKPDK